MKCFSLTAFLSLWLFLASSAYSSAPSKSRSKTSALNLASVRSVVKANMPTVQKCYSDLLIEGMATTGKIVVTWDIDDKGAVQNVAVKDEKPDAQALAGCVTEKLATWTFAPAEPAKTFPVTYTFNFGN